MSKRAKRLADYLEDECGYTIYDEARQCKQCLTTTFLPDSKFCSNCGAKLPKFPNKEAQKKVVAGLEAAIAYALNEHQADR